MSIPVTPALSRSVPRATKDEAVARNRTLHKALKRLIARSEARRQTGKQKRLSPLS